MPRRDDIQKVMILGSGPIRIGQAAEFDFSGSQACRALRSDGYEVVLVNSNPATIQNDPEMADRIYIEPLLPEVVTRIMELERPDALLAGMGGQTALNIASALANDGTLDELGVELIGCNLASINEAEDRDQFKRVCEEIDLPVCRAIACDSIDEVIVAAEERDTRGLTSMTQYSPVDWSTANCTLQPPLMLRRLINLREASLSIWWSRSERVCWGATTIDSPVWIPIGSTFSIVHTIMALSAPSRMTSYSCSCHPMMLSSISTWPIAE